MAKQKAKRDREDPATNKSLCIRSMIEAHPPGTSAKEIVEAVRKQYGHNVTPTLVYLVKSKMSRPKSKGGAKIVRAGKPVGEAGDMLAAIKAARVLLRSAGDHQIARQVLDAIAD